jgi:Protein of unknown function (DUF4233)
VRALTFYGVPGKMTRRLAGVVIGTQGLAVFFGALVARALAAASGSNTSNTFLLFGSLLAVLCILDAGLLRRPWGVTLGWVLQIATFACAFVVPMMLLVGLLFGALWVTVLVQGRRMDDHTERVDAQWRAAQETPASEVRASETSAAEAPAEGRPAEGRPAEGKPGRDG